MRFEPSVNQFRPMKPKPGGVELLRLDRLALEALVPDDENPGEDRKPQNPICVRRPEATQPLNFPKALLSGPGPQVTRGSDQTERIRLSSLGLRRAKLSPPAPVGPNPARQRSQRRSDVPPQFWQEPRAASAAAAAAALAAAASWAAAVRQHKPPGIYYATAYWVPHSKSVEVRNVLDKNGDVYGFYNDSITVTGWGILEIRAGYSSQILPNEIIMFLAGYLEGYLTAPHMSDHFTNLYPQLIKDPSVMDKVQRFMEKQDIWTRKNVKEQKDDPFWRHTGYVMAQLDGLYVGALKRAYIENMKPMTMAQVQFLNAVGDLLDLIPSLSPTKGGNMKVFKRWDMGHCSALIKVLPGFENIYFAHSSWYTYAAMLRIYKHWDFNIKDKYTTSSRLSFSSYPGFLESLDDFYILSSGLVLLQTTNSVYNKTLLKFVVPESLLAWQRVRVANMMAVGGKDWAEIFSRYNSGTYNNQYMVLDLKKVAIKKSLDKGTLYIVEQIPTYVEYSEQTDVLKKGYWPSYNIPFHEKIYNWSGYPLLVQKLGLDYSYDLAPRAKIFRRDQGKVIDVASMKYIMRYNNYKKDPYSKGDPCNTICCREDLNEASPSPGGCYDTKVADIFLASKYAAYAISGPTVQGGLPAFNWNRFNKTLHAGMPEVYDFDFVTMKPILTQ